MPLSMESLIQHTMANVPYYQSLCAGESTPADGLVALSPLARNTVVQSPNSFLAADYLLFPKKENMVILRSMGASGRPLKVHWDAQALENAHAAVRRLRQEWYGISPGDAYCYFFTMEYRRNSLVYALRDSALGEDGRSLGFAMRNLSGARLRTIHADMLSFDPVWLSLTPHIAIHLAEAIQSGRLPALPRLRYVELTGELSDKATRTMLTAAFACPIGNLYATAEAGGVALACPKGHLHILEENVFVEAFRDGQPVPGGVEGALTLTSRLNYAMPLLWYQTGDRGCIDKAVCPCGHPSPVLRLTAARANDFVRLPDGGRIVADVFLYAIETINERIGPIIRQFRIAQTSAAPLAFAVTLVLHPSYSGWRDMVQTLFVENLREDALQGAAFAFEFGEQLLPDDPARPLGYFRNDAKEDKAHG